MYCCFGIIILLCLNSFVLPARFNREGVAGFFSGLGPALVLVSNPVIQFVCYEQFTSTLLNVRSKSAGKVVKALTPYEYFVLGAAAKAVATGTRKILAASSPSFPLFLSFVHTHTHTTGLEHR